MQKRYALGLELVPIHIIPPDLAPCELFMYPNLQICLDGPTFSSNEIVIDAINDYCRVSQNLFFTGWYILGARVPSV